MVIIQHKQGGFGEKKISMLDIIIIYYLHNYNFFSHYWESGEFDWGKSH
jgi:hypothetical protein